MINKEISYFWLGIGFLSCSLYFLFYLDIPHGNLIINILKSFFFIIPLFYLIFFKVKKPSTEVIILSVLYIFMFFSFLIGVILEGGLFRDIFFANTIFCIGYLFIHYKSFSVITDSLFLGIILSLIIGGIIDYNAYSGGYSIWNEKYFVGGLGNPSSFGLLCNLSIAWLMFSRFSVHRIPNFPKLLVVFILSLLSIMSFSVFSILNLLMIFMLFIFLSPFVLKIKASITFIFLVSILILSANFSLLDAKQILFLLSHKIMSLGDFLGLVNYDMEESTSVIGRVAIHERALDLFNKNWISIFLGHPDFISYDKNDSQLLTYALSFGIPLMIAFMLLNIRLLFLTFCMREKFNFVFFASFFLIFFTNRILDYFPIALIYFVMVASVTNKNKKSV